MVVARRESAVWDWWPMDTPATQKDLMGFAARQIQDNLEQEAEIAALRQMLIEHMAQTLAIQESTETPEEREKLEAEFTAKIVGNFGRLKRRWHQEVLEQVESKWPEFAAHFDKRTPEDMSDLF